MGSDGNKTTHFSLTGTDGSNGHWKANFWNPKTKVSSINIRSSQEKVPNADLANLAKVYIGAVYEGVGVKEKLCGTMPATVHNSTVYNIKCDDDVVGDYVKIQTGRVDFMLAFSDVSVIATGKYGGKMFNKD
jgi:hypothetical protein